MFLTLRRVWGSSLVLTKTWDLGIMSGLDWVALLLSMVESILYYRFNNSLSSSPTATVQSTLNSKWTYHRMSSSHWKKSLNTLARRLIWFRTKSTRSRQAASTLQKKPSPILPTNHSDRIQTGPIKGNNCQISSELSNASKIARQTRMMRKEATTRRFKSTNTKYSSLRSK